MTLDFFSFDRSSEFAGRVPTCHHTSTPLSQREPAPFVAALREGGLMRRRQSGSAAPADWPRGLRAVIRAAEHECPRGHARALRDLTALALIKVPARGIFDPGVRNEDDLFAAIESIATTHLAFVDARAAWRSALKSAGLSFDQRDALERAALELRGVSDTAYFYAGLAFGLAYFDVSRHG